MLSNRKDYKDYCLRALGHPVVQVNVEHHQVEDRINDALRFWQDRHMEATERTYLAYVVEQEDIDAGYIEIEDDVIAVTDILPCDSQSAGGVYGPIHQMMSNSVSINSTGGWFSMDIGYYSMLSSYINTVKDTFKAYDRIGYSRYKDRLEIHNKSFDSFTAGKSYIVIECFKLINPTEFVQVWSDPFLLEYGTQLIKRQWGTNLKKFKGTQLAGNVELDGQTIYDEANEEIKRLEEDRSKYELPPKFYFG